MAAIIFLIPICLGVIFYVGLHIQELQKTNNDLSSQLRQINETKSNSPKFSPAYTLQNETCTTDECIVASTQDPDHYGVATVKGFYTRIIKSAWGATATCEAITVTSGAKFFTDQLTEQVKKGNTLNTIDSKGRLVLVTDMSLLNKESIEKLKGSNESRQFDLILFKKKVAGSGAPVCYPNTQVLTVK